MARLRRKWRVLKWAGLVVSLLIVVTWAASIRWTVAHTASGGEFRSFSLQLGGLAWLSGGGNVPMPMWGWKTYRCPLSVSHWPWIPSFHYRSPMLSIWLPLWIPFLIIAVPTGCLWWVAHPRRIPLGHCQKCGYNLTGNVSGVCPECGERA